MRHYVSYKEPLRYRYIEATPTHFRFRGDIRWIRYEDKPMDKWLKESGYSALWSEFMKCYEKSKKV